MLSRISLSGIWISKGALIAFTLFDAAWANQPALSVSGSPKPK